MHYTYNEGKNQEYMEALPNTNTWKEKTLELIRHKNWRQFLEDVKNVKVVQGTQKVISGPRVHSKTIPKSTSFSPNTLWASCKIPKLTYIITNLEVNKGLHILN